LDKRRRGAGEDREEIKRSKPSPEPENSPDPEISSLSMSSSDFVAAADTSRVSDSII